MEKQPLQLYMDMELLYCVIAMLYFCYCATTEGHNSTVCGCSMFAIALRSVYTDAA